MLTPNKIAKESEHSQQAAFFAYLAVAAKVGFAAADYWAETGEACCLQFDPIPELAWIHAIPNGGARGDNAKSNAIRGAQLKAEGVRPGVFDVFVPIPTETYAGLYIEFKKPSLYRADKPENGLSEDQKRFREHLNRSLYHWKVVYTWMDAVAALKRYLKFKFALSC